MLRRKLRSFLSRTAGPYYQGSMLCLLTGALENSHLGGVPKRTVIWSTTSLGLNPPNYVIVQAVDSEGSVTPRLSSGLLAGT